MSINGVLEDLPLADVLQFIHLGRRTGTLFMWQGDDRRAEIGFRDGKIISAWLPNQSKIGDLLVNAGHLDQENLDNALACQQVPGERRSIGQILLDSTNIPREIIYRVIKEQIQKTIFELVSWRQGHFHFEVDELNPVDDFGISPADLLDNLDINTQMLLLEATRLFDEKRRDDSGQVAAVAEPASRLDEHLRRAGLGRTDDEHRGMPRPGKPPTGFPASEPAEATKKAPTLEAIRCQVVSDDQRLRRALRDQLPHELARVVNVPLRDAGTKVPGESTSPIVVLDLRAHVSVGDIGNLARTRPAAPVVALVPEITLETPAYEAGALAVTADIDRVATCCRNLIRVLNHPQPTGTFGSVRGGLTRFRQVALDVQSGMSSTTMALNLMHVISESVDRAILFLVAGDELDAVGAFGFAGSGAPLAEVTRGLRIEPEPGGSIDRVLTDANPLSLEFDDCDLPEKVLGTVGRPASGQVVLFPVLGAERTIAVIYTDNGGLAEEIQDIKILELATSQVGVALENELLRQELGAGLAEGVDEDFELAES